MKVCTIFESDGSCGDCLFMERDNLMRPYCDYLWTTDYDTTFDDSLCPSEGCRPDCPLIPCEGIIKDFEDLNSYISEYASYDGISDDSIKFIKACEENQ